MKLEVSCVSRWDATFVGSIREPFKPQGTRTTQNCVRVAKLVRARTVMLVIGNHDSYLRLGQHMCTASHRAALALLRIVSKK